MADIVERLEAKKCGFIPSELELDAAAEIKRLRADLLSRRQHYSAVLGRCVVTLVRIAELTPHAANAATALDLHHAVRAIAGAALWDGDDALFSFKTGE